MSNKNVSHSAVDPALDDDFFEGEYAEVDGTQFMGDNNDYWVRCFGDMNYFDVCDDFMAEFPRRRWDEGDALNRVDEYLESIDYHPASEIPRRSTAFNGMSGVEFFAWLSIVGAISELPEDPDEGENEAYRVMSLFLSLNWREAFVAMKLADEISDNPNRGDDDWQEILTEVVYLIQVRDEAFVRKNMKYLFDGVSPEALLDMADNGVDDELVNSILGAG